MNTKRLLLLVTLLVVLIGAVSASEASEETLRADTSDVNDAVAQDTTPATATVQESVTTEAKESKKIVKDEKNSKTASKTYDVSDFNTLHSSLTNDEYDTVVVNIKSNIKLMGSTSVNNAIKTVTINGNGKTINGDNKYQFLFIYSDSKVTINNLKITNCNSAYGGAIENHYGILTIKNSALNNNKAIDGGAIYNYDYATMTLTGSSLYNNQADYGGAIDNKLSKLNINNVTFTKNNAAVEGGAIHNTASTFTVTDSTFTNNNAEENGGAIYNFGTLTIKNSTLNNNYAEENGGAIFNDEDSTMTLIGNTLNNNTSKYKGGAIYSIGEHDSIQENKFINNKALMGSAISFGDYIVSVKGNDILIDKNTFITNKAEYREGAESTGEAIIDEGINTIIKGNTNDNTSFYSYTIYIEGNNTHITNNIFDDGIINTKTNTSTVKGIIGEKLTLKATVTDINNNKVNEGNLIFKLNGVTIKDNSKLTGSSNPLKVKITNGIATTTITPDLDMRNADKLTAHYIGTNNYNASASSIAKIQISQRNASIVVTSNVKTIKQGQVLTLTAKVYDTTNGKKSTNLTKYADEFVYFKVNGITLKDSKGNMLKVKVVNGTATTKYTIPLGLSGVTDGKTMTPKNHTILAGFYNKNYQENIRNTSTFQVERSNITITISNATVNNKTHKLSLTATIKDYMGNIVKGPNKCVIKINGVSLKNGTQPMYYYSTDGILNIKNIDIPSYNKYTSIEIVTQDRLAYKSQRNTTTKIKITN